MEKEKSFKKKYAEIMDIQMQRKLHMTYKS